MTDHLAQSGSAIRWDQLHLSPVAWDFGVFELRWYALSYLAMLVLGWWYLAKLVAQPGAPMGRRHLEDLFLYVFVGVLAGGRLGYCLFYNPAIWAQPWKVLELWNGGMSLHGGFIGVMIGIWLFARRNQLDLLRVYDYVACATPFGLFLVRIANFVNGELWGRPTALPWGIIFPGTLDNVPRHPSQLYEALLEGAVMALILWPLFWRTGARYRRGLLLGTGLIIYGTARFLLEFVRQPDAGMEHLSWGLTMGQTLSAPMLLAGFYLVFRSRQASRPQAPPPAAAK